MNTTESKRADTISRKWRLVEGAQGPCGIVDDETGKGIANLSNVFGFTKGYIYEAADEEPFFADRTNVAIMLFNAPETLRQRDKLAQALRDVITLETELYSKPPLAAYERAVRREQVVRLAREALQEVSE